MQCTKWLYLFSFFSIMLFGAERGWNSLELAKVYFHHSQPQREWAWGLLKHFHLEGAEQILDFGCGDGKITAELSCLVPNGHVSGVDLSKSMIHLAKIHFPETFYANLTFSQTESENFDEISGVYDVICAFSVFHFVTHPVNILTNLKAHLQKEGRLLLTIPSPPASVMRQAADEMFAKYNLNPPWYVPGYSSKFSMRSLEGCRQKLEEAGFEILMLQKIDAPMIFHDLSECIDWFIGSISANWGIPFELSRVFCTDVVWRMIELDPSVLNEEGCVALPEFSIHVIAKP